MKNIEDILKSLGIEVPADKTAELTKQVAENYKTINEHEKRVQGLEGERDGYKDKYEAAQKTISGFEEMDIDGVKDELAKYKKQVEDMEADHKKALYDRDFADALKNEIANVKFTSEAAKKSVMADLQSAGLTLVDGKIMGFNDFIANYKFKDASAFVDEQAENLENSKPTFTKPLQTNNANAKTTMTAQIRSAMGLKPEKGE